LKPFRLEVAESALADLRERLKRTRFPDEAPGAPWKTGTSLSYLKDLLQYWQEDDATDVGLLHIGHVAINFSVRDRSSKPEPVSRHGRFRGRR